MERTAATALTGSRITSAVVDAVAEEEGVSPLELRPIAGVLDPDALEMVVAGFDGGTDRVTGTVEFSYSGYDVTVTADGDVSVADPDAADREE